MSCITALLHTENDALRVGRCLETLYPCDDIVIVDHGSRDGTIGVARAYGARVVSAARWAPPEQYLRSALGSAAAGWLFCLDPREALSEALAASLFEWKTESVNRTPAYSVFLREETAQGWVELPAAQTRLVRGDWNRWHGTLPVADESAEALEGELLRFVFP